VKRREFNRPEIDVRPAANVPERTRSAAQARSGM
jgi:hypothetical protein